MTDETENNSEKTTAAPSEIEALAESLGAKTPSELSPEPAETSFEDLQARVGYLANDVARLHDKIARLCQVLAVKI